jgi:hypothetical protein
LGNYFEQENNGHNPVPLLLFLRLKISEQGRSALYIPDQQLKVFFTAIRGY